MQIPVHHMTPRNTQLWLKLPTHIAQSSIYSKSMHITRFLALFILQAAQTVLASSSDQVVLDHTQFSMSNDEQTTTSPSLADLLTIENSASIFYSYARELPLSQLLESSDSHITLFAPTNTAVMALARKPYVQPDLSFSTILHDFCIN